MMGKTKRLYPLVKRRGAQADEMTGIREEALEKNPTTMFAIRFVRRDEQIVGWGFHQVQKRVRWG